MGWAFGGRIVGGKLEELRAELLDYYGTLTEISEGINQPVPEPPEVMVLWRQCKALGLPLAAGGVLDQPHIWLLEMGVLLSVETLMETVSAQAKLSK